MNVGDKNLGDSIKTSVLIVCRNESDYIVECIQSIEKQFEGETIPWELIIIDGLSNDDTKINAHNYLKENAIYHYQIIDNPNMILASGWNLGINAAKGEYIIRPDAHAILYPGYIKNGIKTLEEKQEVGVVGGLLNTLSKGFWGNIIKNALSVKVGVGNSSFRTGADSGYQDTAVYGLYRKELYEELGCFDESLVRHQDTEFHSRINKSKWKIWLNNEMEAGYYCRDNILKFLTQMYNIGYYLPALMKNNNSGGVKARHFAPFVFYSCFISSLIIGIFFPLIMHIGLAVYGIYVLGIFISAIIQSVKTGKVHNFLLFYIIPLMHIAYFWGTLNGLIINLFKAN